MRTAPGHRLAASGTKAAAYHILLFAAFVCLPAGGAYARGGPIRGRPVHADPGWSTTATVVTLARLIRFGYSRDGRPLVAMVLGGGPNVTVILGGVHGNEKTPPRLVRDLTAYLEQHPADTRGDTVVLEPAVNPDGLATNTRTNAAAVDLNRNFPGDWRPPSPRLRSGSKPASEPETQAIMHLLAQYHPQKVISVHSPLDVLDWSGRGGQQLAQEMSRLDHYPMTHNIGYPTPGSLGQYCARHGMAIVTMEIPPVSAARAWQRNRAALLAAIRLDLRQPAMPTAGG